MSTPSITVSYPEISSRRAGVRFSMAPSLLAGILVRLSAGGECGEKDSSCEENRAGCDSRHGDRPSAALSRHGRRPYGADRKRAARSASQREENHEGIHAHRRAVGPYRPGARSAGLDRVCVRSGRRRRLESSPSPPAWQQRLLLVPVREPGLLLRAAELLLLPAAALLLPATGLLRAGTVLQSRHPAGPPPLLSPGRERGSGPAFP